MNRLARGPIAAYTTEVKHSVIKVEQERICEIQAEDDLQNKPLTDSLYIRQLLRFHASLLLIDMPQLSAGEDHSFGSAYHFLLTLVSDMLVGIQSFVPCS